MKRWLAMAAATTALLLSPPPHARAVDQLAVSLDGENWSPTVERGLFDASRTWVPGDAVSVPVWVRNDSGGPAELSVDVVDVTGRLRAGRELQLRAAVGGAAVQPVGDRLPIGVLADSSPLRVDLRLSFPFSSGNDTQQRSGVFRLRMTLRGVAATVPTASSTPAPRPTPTRPGSAGPSGGSSAGTSSASADGGLPSTGVPRGLGQAIVVGLALVALGITLLLGRKRGSS